MSNDRANNTRSRQLTWIEILIGVLGVVCAYLGAQWFGWVGIICGLVFGLTILHVLYFLFFWIHYPFRLRLPICINGCCGEKDYASESVSVDGEVLKCKCGNRYLLTYSRPKRLMQFDHEGQAKPFLIRQRSQWAVDHGAKDVLVSRERGMSVPETSSAPQGGLTQPSGTDDENRQPSAQR